MPRYIDAEKLASRINASPAFKNADDGSLLLNVVLDIISKFPEADVVPAAIGEWVENEDGCQCSICGLQYFGEYDAECMPEFCPRCFARMYCPLDGESYEKVEQFKREKEAQMMRKILEEFRDKTKSEIRRNEQLFNEENDDFYEGRNDAFRTATAWLVDLIKKHTEETQ